MLESWPVASGKFDIASGKFEQMRPLSHKACQARLLQQSQYATDLLGSLAASGCFIGGGLGSAVPPTSGAALGYTSVLCTPPQYFHRICG